LKFFTESHNSPETNEKELTLTSEFIDSYTIPIEWDPLIKSGFFQNPSKKPSTLKTEYGIFLLNPIHLEKQVPIEEFHQ